MATLQNIIHANVIEFRAYAFLRMSVLLISAVRVSHLRGYLLVGTTLVRNIDPPFLIKGVLNIFFN